MAKRNDKLESRSTKGNSNKPARKFPYFRKLKVRKSHYHSHHGDFQPRPYQRPEPVPWINLHGYWLKEAGFSIGEPVTLIIGQGWMFVNLESAHPRPAAGAKQL